MSINFKLAKRGGVTRRISFAKLPSWHELAGRISALYSIPHDQVAVSYVDLEDDEVTLSTNEELQEFYQASGDSPDVIKFAVQDLSARLDDKSLPETPLSTGNIRNTFGRESGLPFDIDQDWQNVHTIPIFAAAMPNNDDDDGPHAFVEVVPTDASISSRDSDNHSTAASDFLLPRHDKGKGKAMDPASSTASLWNERMASKHDLHVFGRPDNSNPSIEDLTPPSPASSSVPTISAPIESTPKMSAKKVDSTTADTVSAAEVADPPLPTFETSNPSLTQDVAALLTILSTVVSTHPELSEGLRNIVRNAANGTYWQTHREALRNAADNLSQGGVSATVVEEEAGKRVAEALGNIFRAMGNVAGPFSSGGTEPVSRQDTGTQGRGWRASRGARFGGFWGGPPHALFGGHRPQYAPPPWGGPVPPPPPPPVQPTPPVPEHKQKAASQDLRAQVEAAKLLYKAEKERYRQEREERKKEKESRLRLIADTAAEPQPTIPKRSSTISARSPGQIVSNAHGPYPQLEMFNVRVPRRHSTLPSNFERAPRADVSTSTVNESASARSLARIHRKLADVCHLSQLLSN